jgi:hypothetical protein
MSVSCEAFPQCWQLSGLDTKFTNLQAGKCDSERGDFDTARSIMRPFRLTVSFGSLPFLCDNVMKGNGSCVQKCALILFS